MASLLKRLRDSRQKARTKKERLVQLREEYIEHIIDSVDLDGLVDLARCHLEAQVPHRSGALLAAVREHAPNLLDDGEV